MPLDTINGVFVRCNQHRAGKQGLRLETPLLRLNCKRNPKDKLHNRLVHQQLHRSFNSRLKLAVEQKAIKRLLQEKGLIPRQKSSAQGCLAAQHKLTPTLQHPCKTSLLRSRLRKASPCPTFHGGYELHLAIGVCAQDVVEVTKVFVLCEVLR